MRIYFNSSALNRPFDDLSVARVRHEAEAVAALFAEIESGRIDLVSSEYLDFEVGQCPDPERVARVSALLRVASRRVSLSARAAARARELEAVGLRGLDALHLAAAEAGRVALLVTTDDRMLKRARRLDPPSPVKTVLPAEALRLVRREGEA